MPALFKIKWTNNIISQKINQLQGKLHTSVSKKLLRNLYNFFKYWKIMEMKIQIVEKQYY